MSQTKHVRILSGALDEDQGRIILRGAIDPGCLDALLVDTYQRGVQPTSSLGKILKGFEPGGAIPDIELGMRGTKRSFRDSVYTLHDPVYIIDGLQRVSAAKIFLANGGVPHLGATVRFSTDFEFERQQFKVLNADRVRVTANVLFRNERTVNETVESLCSMCESDDQFVLKGRVCWDQSHSRGHLITAMGMGRVIAVLHSHLSSSSPSMDAYKLAQRVGLIAEMVGKNIFRSNIRTFYDIVDYCWGLKRVVYREKAPFIRLTFLLTLAKILSNHEAFWRGNRLFMDTDLRNKVAKFKVYEPTVVQLASTGAKIDPVLYKMLVDQINSGKRTKRLKERLPLDLGDEAEEANGEEVVASAAAE